MRTMILALACCSLPVFANECNVELSGNLQLEDKILEITLNDDTQVKIDQYRDLTIDGQALDLNDEQQSWVNSYYDGINQAAPQAANIATQAIALASSALNEVFTELLGSDSDALDGLSEKLQDLDEKIQYNFYADNGEIRLHSESFENGEFFGHEWEAQFEEEIEELVSESIGQLMISIGTQLVFSGGDMQAFEQKMERFGEQIEQKVEYQAAALEAQADALCDTLAKVDFAENKLQKHISQLASLDIIQIQDQPNLM